MDRLHTDDKGYAYAALKASLHALRDRIGPENAVHLGAQLPTLIRGVYYEGWRIAGTPTKERHLQEFPDRIREEFPPGLAREDPQRAMRAVCEGLCEKIDPRADQQAGRPAARGAAQPLARGRAPGLAQSSASTSALR